jgi:hypothetical protein
MLEMTDRDVFCRTALADDWFGLPHATPFRTGKKMWEVPRAEVKVQTIRPSMALQERFTQSLWPSLYSTPAADPRTKASEKGSGSKINRLASEIEEAVRESALANAVSVEENTKRMAIRFATALPASLPAPEVGTDPDGEISFDWLGPANKIFSVSVDSHGRLAYAGRFGEKRKINGVEQLVENCPPEIIWGIKRAFA